MGRRTLLNKLFHKDGSNEDILWGILHIKVIKCRGLRNLDQMFGVGKFLGKHGDKSDPYVTAWLGDYRLLKTRVISNDLDPVFNEEFYCPVAHATGGVMFKVKDKDTVKDESLGEYFLSVTELIQMVDEKDLKKDENLLQGDFKRVGIQKEVYLDGKKRHGSLEFFVEYIPVRMLAKSIVVPGVYFSKTRGNDVLLYMNADDDGSTPKITYGGRDNDEKVWKPRRLWRDIYDAICDAKHFVYMVGWSIDVDQYLLRGAELEKALEESKYSPQIGNLLKKKSEEGVIVNLMQWDDYSSNFAFPGMMGTHDEKTRNFFSNTNVNSTFMHTVGDETNTMFEGQNKKMAFTHHQKFIMMDSPKKDGSGRELLAFVGGIDLTEGRWDNQKHPLFRTLQSDHKGDTYNKCFRFSNKENGPRQPWHDIHSAVRGPEALHLIQAFTERWTKQASKMSGELANLRRLGLAKPKELENKSRWYAQLSRSIDSRVNNFDKAILQSFKDRKDDNMKAVKWRSIKEKEAVSSKRFESATYDVLKFNRCLDQKKGRLVDTSIHMTNIHHIRRAKHFIYIESQYFMGSSFMWTDSKDRKVKCSNLIPAEITLKICQKIADDERFAVYILLPMWPEGIPDSNANQGLLYWQYATISAMYNQIQKAIDNRMANTPDFGLKVSDYLNFYCLGTRETAEGSQSIESPATDEEKLLANTRRHQIYIHSKMMIVDDEVVLIGTANINQRSMDGCRDSEIMMTAWHPDFLATENSTPNGDIHAYRLHIWASITGRMSDIYRDPSNKKCISAINKVAERNWRTFMGDETVDMKSHLLPSPFFFDGRDLRARKELSNGRLPDTKADVVGKKSIIFPDLFLT